MVPGKWSDYGEILERNGVHTGEDGYEGVINPIEVNSSYEGYYGWEECPSFPGIKFKVLMPLFSNIKYIP